MWWIRKYIYSKIGTINGYWPDYYWIDEIFTLLSRLDYLSRFQEQNSFTHILINIKNAK